MLTVNAVLKAVFAEPPFEHPMRVLWTDREIDLVMLFALKEPYGVPTPMRLSDLESMLAADKLRKVSMRLPSFMLQTEDELSDAAKAKRTQLWGLIGPIFADKQIYLPGKLGPIIAAYASKINKPKKTIYRLVYRYWAFGMTPNAFLGKYIHSGAPGVEREYSGEKKAGRPARYLGEESQTTKKLTEDDKRIIKIGYTLYKNNGTRLIIDAYNKMLDHFYRVEVASPDGSCGGAPLKQLDQVPSPTQFSYWGKKAFDAMDVMRGRKGETKWAMDHRPIVGNAHHGLRGPCHRFEIDATIADVYLVSRFNRNWIIGRPVVYVVIDVMSRMIVGLHVGLEGPSWNIARHALFNAFTDKVAYCASFGIVIDPADWPCEHLPHEVVGDRGEMLGEAAEQAMHKLSITLDILPPFRADWKGTVESSFRLLQSRGQIRWMPGGLKSREKERGQRDYRLDATLDLHQFTSIMIRSVLDWNHHSRDPKRLSKVMIGQNVEPTPIAIWNWAAQNDLIEPNERTREEIYLHLLPQARGSVQAGGIYINGMFYNNVLDPTGKRSANARANGRESIDIWSEPMADHIWIKDRSGAFVQCPLRSTEARCVGMRTEEVVDMLAITGAISPESQYAALNSRVDLAGFVESTVATASAAKQEAQVPTSAAAAVAGIKGNRALERDIQRADASAAALCGNSEPFAAGLTSAPAPAKRESSVASEYAGARGAEVISLLSRAGRNRSK